MAITIDRQAAARYGVTMDAIDQTLYDAFGQRQIATVFATLTQYHVILEVDAGVPRRSRHSRQDLRHAGCGAGNQQRRCIVGSRRGVRGRPRPPCRFPRSRGWRRRTTPLTITHQGLFPATTISFNLAPGASLGAALDALHASEQAIGMPDTVTTNLAGAAAEFSASLSSERLLILAAIVTVYIVLGMLYESFIHPITILSTLPSAGVGALLALIWEHEALDLISLIGIILLIGIVKKNAIMMVDFALEAERREAMSPLDAIRQACILRFRPIMMTTMAALLGALPLALGVGTGSELRRPLGVAIVGGLLVSQVLTLYTTPVIYLAFSSLRRRFGRRCVASARAAE